MEIMHNIIETRPLGVERKKAPGGKQMLTIFSFAEVKKKAVYRKKCFVFEIIFVNYKSSLKHQFPFKSAIKQLSMIFQCRAS